MAFFLYEDEEARIQNRLEEIWKRIDALQRSAGSREVAFIQGVTRTTDAILDRLLGQGLFSLRSIAVSMAFSLSSLLLVISLMVLATEKQLKAVLLIPVFVSLFLFGLSSLPAYASQHRPMLQRITDKKIFYHTLVIIVILLSWCCSIVLLQLLGSKGVDNILVALVAAGFSLILDIIVIAPGVAFDVLFIAFFRWMLRKIARQLSAWTVAAYIVGLTLATVVVVGPVAAVLFPRSALSVSVIGPMWRWSVGRFLILAATLVSMTNLVDAACLILLMTVMLALLIHRVIWPFIKRPIYAANRKGLVKNTKLLGALGTMLLLYAFPDNPLVKWITDFLSNLKGG